MPFRRTPFTGFPFDDTDPDEFMRFRNTSQRSHIDDLAARHPEIAEYLRPWGAEFPSRTTRKRHPSGSCGDDDVRSQASGSSNESANPPFSSGDFDKRNIFDSDFGLPEHFRRRFENLGHPRDVHHEQQPNSTRPQVPKPEKKQANNNLPQYGLRNTVDLGQKQKQESFDEGAPRGQRSMSAPPDNRSNQPQQRFISRINIDPVNPDSVSSSQQQHHQQQSSTEMGGNTSSSKPPKQPNVRHIPIYVEGRDEPVLPKNVNTEYTQPPNKEEYFNRDPSVFTQFLHKEPPHKQQQHVPPQYHQTFRSQQSPPQQAPPQQAQSETLQQPEPTHQQRATSPKPPLILNPIEKIQAIQKDVSELMDQVDKFDGSGGKDKQYLYLDEMLTRNLLKLDDIDTEGKENIRQARKEAIKCIERCIGILEAKVEAMKAAKENESKKESMQVSESKIEEPAAENTEKMDFIAEDSNKTEQQAPVSSESTENSQAEPVQAVLEVGGVKRSGSEVKNMSETNIPMDMEQKTESADTLNTDQKKEVDQSNLGNENTEIKSSENNKMEVDEKVSAETNNTPQQIQSLDAPSQEPPAEENKNTT